MTRNTIYRLLLTVALTMTGAVALMAQTYAFRYVSATNGTFAGDGTSWATAKNNLQNAIEELNAEISAGRATVGYVFVQGAEGEGMKYVPTMRSTSDADGSVFNTSFRIYGGIHVFGGFRGDETDPAHPEDLPNKRLMEPINGVNCTYADVVAHINADDIENAVRRWNFRYKTVLSGNHSTNPYTFTFDTYRGIYSTSFPLSSYHVVWFATNGKIGGDDGSTLVSGEKEMGGHFMPLAAPASVDGCTIEGGFASSTSLQGHSHQGYGGGVYMVKNATLRNCIVHHCAATMRGGAVYLDGGGTVERCYIHTSQVSGYGMQQGYGGAVCIDYDGSVQHSYIVQCAARIGAGLAICHVPYEYPEQTLYPTAADRANAYSPFALSTVIANCTSNAEGAGVYLSEGGTLNHCSVVNNKCVGPDVIYYGRRHGRTGGIYVRNGGTIYNTVAWGNESAVNNDVQYASYKDASTTRKIEVHHCAFSKMDLTDWSSTTRKVIVSLANENYPTSAYHEGNFPLFAQPTAAAGIQYDPTTKAVNPAANAPGQPYQRVYNWHPLSSSALRMRAVQVTDALQDVADEIIHAHTDVDVVGRAFEPVSSIGGVARSYRNLVYAMAPSQEPGETGDIPTIFMDPNRVVYDATNTATSCGYDDNQPAGDSWTHPCGNLSDAITFFKNHLHEGGDEESTYYDLDGQHYPHVQILVKQGSLTVAGQGAYLSGHARTASLRPGSNMRLYGGFAPELTGTAVNVRSPHHYRTSLSANVLGGDFDNNSVHVIAIANQHNVIIDGFHLYSGNANIVRAAAVTDDGSKTYELLADGAGIVVNNAMSADNKRIDMVGNVLRNAVIANCAAPEGSAVYVGGGYRHGTEDRLCRAELTIVNTVIRNNTAGDIFEDHDRFVEGNSGEDSDAGTIVSNGNAHVWVRNCDIVNNCGYALKATKPQGEEVATNAVTNPRGYIEIYNSILFSNGQRISADRSNISKAVSCKWTDDNTISGNYIYLDHDATKPDMPDFIKCFNYLTRSKSQDGQSGLCYNSATQLVDKPCTLHYPYFVNPSRNVGHSTGEDYPMYGGVISYEPLPTNPIVNGAFSGDGYGGLDDGNGLLTGLPDFSGTAEEQMAQQVMWKSRSMSYDRELTDRTYGGDPDAGAIETMRLPRGGAVIYVTPDGAGKRDGSSWANAIAGNTVYMLDNVAGPALAAGDQLDPEATCDRILDSDGNPVLTTDSKYCGGFGRVWFTDWKTGATSTTTVTQAWITERNVYVGGTRDGEVEVLQDGTTPTESIETTTTIAGTTPTGFIAGYDYDSRYPYGEISGASRSFWRANPYHNGTDWNNSKDYADVNAFTTACNNNHWINNERKERYLSGLQYAVEKAAAYNASGSTVARLEGVDSIQVWVSNGKYTDYKGFVMRDNTTVLGSFPAVNASGTPTTPGLSERHALMSDVINIPKSLSTKDLKPIDYETILQLSDEDPKKDNETLNPDAVKFWDDDLSKMQTTDTRSYKYKDLVIVHHYGLEIDTQTDKTSSYLQFADMKNGSANVWASRTTTDEGDLLHYRHGTASGTFDCWHLTAPKANVDKIVKNFHSSGGDIYDNGTKVGTAGQRAWIRDGCLTGVNIWQTMTDVPEGDYMLQVDIAAFYYDEYAKANATANYNGNDNNPNTNVYIYLLDASGKVLAKAKAPGYPGSRTAMKRTRIPFTVATTGNVTFKVSVGPGLDKSGEEVADDFTLAMNRNPNRREINMTNLVLYEVTKGTNYVEYPDLLENTTNDRTVDDPESPTTITTTLYEVQTHRTSLRKRVLTMPDVCVPTYGAGSVGDPATTSDKDRGKFSDALSHTHRVTGDTKSKRTSWESASFVNEDPNYVEYSDVVWDGFTIRHGFISDEAMAHGGGAGVNMYEGAHLQNCVIIDNMVYCSRVKGCGIFCDGATSTIEGCFVLDNTATHGTSAVQNQIFAGGMFMYEGTCFNSLFAKNYSYGSAGGLGFCVGRFYNNTIAYNTCLLDEDGDGIPEGGAISLATSSSPNLFVANTIIYGNNGVAIRDRNTNVNNVNPFLHCYVQSEVAQPNGATNRNVGNWPTKTGSNNNYGIGNVYLNGVAPSALTTPFAADIAGGSYDEANPGAKATNDFRLTNDLSDCINKGTEDFAGTFYTALKQKRNWDDTTIRSSFIYQSVDAAELPDNDVAFAQRVQDCQIDMGAYEFDGAKFIEPMLFPEEREAVFYVTQNGAGMATATDPANAACYLKFQKVLDAAGRWRYASYFYNNYDSSRYGEAGYNYNVTNFTTDVLTAELNKAKTRAEAAGGTLNVEAELPKLRDYKVIVKLEGDNGSHFSYVPTRTTRTTDNENPNDLEMSLIVPHGIIVEGGYEANFTSDRDQLGRPTLLNGEIYNSTLGITGNVYHVVTFTNDLYDVNEHLYTVGANNEMVHGQLAFLADADTHLSGGTAAEKRAWVNDNRTVLDGVFIENGHANGAVADEKRGAGAVVTDYAHIRNCVVQNNTAAGSGGGLYLEPAALVSGCIIKNNHAYTGGGLYVPDPASGRPGTDTYVHLLTSTVVGNTAETTAGGLWFDMNLRANSSAFWLNRANDLNNVAGLLNTDETQIVDNYPLNYCGVESRRVNGVNNIELPVAETDGVRWNHSEAHEAEIHALLGGTDITYYPITLSSVLGRAGMTYAAYEEMRAIYPTLELTDIAGLNRLAQGYKDDATQEEYTLLLANGTTFTKVHKDNNFIEMGARVLNASFELKVELRHIMKRLFVTTTEELPSEAALALQTNAATGDDAAADDAAEMYRQMGSSFLNPFHRFGDALEYIIQVRKSTQEYTDAKGNKVWDDALGRNKTLGDVYKDERFEVFVGGGTFYPFRDAHGRQGEARANTFVVPEKVTIVGGVDPSAIGHAYCQDTIGTKTVAGYTLYGIPTATIRADRTHLDRNGNRVMEPWELEHQTILSGNAVNTEARTNVYHVITCFSDKNQVGQLPSRYGDNSGTAEVEKDYLLPDMLGTMTPSIGDRLVNMEAESSTSRDARTIVIDGVTITGGHANDLEDDDVTDNFQKLTYFRGGGIFVDGNWDNSFDSSMDLPEVLSVARRDIPMITTNCLFQDNMAANGGAVYTNGTFYAFSCHFTKNVAEGPNTEVDQQYIPWSAGGAIANNYTVNVWNSLFDNNEAHRGAMPINHTAVHNADARQGYGGAISCSETGLLRIANCDFVRNKAVAYPALYNFIDNNIRAHSSKQTPSSPDYYGAGHHFAVNSIFWGNEATATTIAPANEIEEHYYKDQPTRITVNADGSLSPDLRRPNHVANFGPLMDIATLTFCSYEKNTGREGTVWHDNHDYAKTAAIPSLEQLYAGDFVGVLNEYFGWYPDGSPTTPFCKEEALGDDAYRYVPCAPGDADARIRQADGTLRAPTATEIAHAIPYNYNLVLNSENTEADGPYFVQPSITAGADGYMETADWLVARLNPTIDTGWGYLKQQVSVKPEDIHTGLLSTDFTKDAEGTVPADADDDQYKDLYGAGFYNLHAKNIHDRFDAIGFPNLLPIGDEKYMEYVREGSTEGRNMRRISTHPKVGVQDVFIDMGIYEYQYVQLITGGDEVDVIWVNDTEQQGIVCDGSTWEKATSDLQTAIETLLLSLNDHDKVIKMRAGTYSPLKMTDGNQKAFFIATSDKNDGVLTPSGLQTSNQTLTVRSLTFYGGYTDNALADYADGEDSRDPVANPVVFQMTKEEGNTDRQLAHLFIIEDAEVKGNYMNYLTNANKEFKDYPMVISFDGLTFTNPYGISGTDDDEHGGAAIYYREQYMTEQTGDNFNKNHDRLLKTARDPDGDPVPKFMVKNCVFANCGSDANCSALRIEKGGGQSVIVNSLFHSNSGAPIDAVNTTVINSTFALNGGHLILRNATEQYYGGTSASYPSALYNSIIWKDDQNTQEAGTLPWGGALDLASGNMTYNAYTRWDAEPDGNTTDDTQHNFLLSKVNADVMLGPNFIDPKETLTATTPEERQAEKLARNFRLNPSAHILNAANMATYTSHFGAYTYYPDYQANDPISYYDSVENPTGRDLEGSTAYARRRSTLDGEGKTIYYWFHSVQHGNAIPLTEAHMRGTDAHYRESELAFKPRLLNTGMERGAYECEAAVQRVLYVMSGSSGRYDGTSWEDAFDIDQLQKAVDVASIYSMTSPSQERAYVFVRANDYQHDVLHPRDGVSVFGGVNTNNEVVRDGDIYHDDDIAAYIHEMRATRSGIATQGMMHNTLKGLVADNNRENTSGFLLDGFWIQGGQSAVSPVQLTSANTIVRNAVITGNSVSTASKPVIELAGGTSGNALLYNTLVYGNMPGSGAPVVRVGAHGYALNNTIVAPAAAPDIAPVAYVLQPSDITADHDQNNIATTEAKATMFAPYFNTAALPYTPPTDYAPYHYQLHEATEHIDPEAAVPGTGTDDGSTPNSGDNTIAKLFTDYVNFDLDLDILGNPRRLGTRVDNGAYETWRVSDARFADNVTTITPLPTPAMGQSQYEANVAAGYYTTPSYTTNYGGHRYPHPGSVVYVMNGGSLVFATDEGTPLFTSVNPVRPGYVYVQEGGSVYGHGNTLQFPYVAADKAFAADEQRRLMAFPFDVSLAATMATEPQTADAVTSLHVDPAPAFTPYSYDAVGRSAYGYQYKADNSPLWKTDIAALLNADGQVARTKGWLMEFASDPASDPASAPAAAQTLRFTGWGSGTAAAYDEDGSASKVVALDQHNANVVAASTLYPRFTQLENMGWNLKGQPWLVSHFRTDASSADGTDYRMNVPHVIYHNVDNTLAAINAMPDEQAVAAAKATAVRYGQFYTAQSWGSGTDIALGDGFFTQTAIIATDDNEGQEQLVFRRPEYAGTPVAPVKDDLLTVDLWSHADTTAVWADAVQLCARTDAAADMPYRLNSDGVKWLALDPAATQLWLENEGGTAFSLAAHAPLATLLPLTVRTTPEATITFALRQRAAAADSLQAVWLIDREQNRMVNLLDESYTTGIGTAGEAAAQTSGTTTDVAGRFFLQLGGMAQMPEAPATTHAYRVYVRDRVLHILGTNPGDRIRVHTPAGALVLNAEAANDHYHTPLRQEGVYLVTIEHETHKILVR